jgi:hypothetical protein
VNPLSGGFLVLLVFVLAASTASNAQSPRFTTTLQGRCPIDLSPDQGCLMNEDGKVVPVSRDPNDKDLEAPVNHYNDNKK